MAAMPVVYDGIVEPAMDIVSIPGLPDLNPQYQIKDHNEWLRSVLSHHMPSARIMSFGYDFAKPGSMTCWKDLTEQVMKFLYALTHRREGASQMKRPIVFICYSFGSVILKKALLTAKREVHFRPILEHTVGIIFSACIHNDKRGDFEELCLKCAAIEFKTLSRKSASIETLKNCDFWSEIKEVLAKFRELQLPLDVLSFCESRATIYQASRFPGMPPKTDYVCPKNVACLGWAKERVVEVDADHGQLSTFASRSDSFFETFVDYLSKLAEPYYNPRQAVRVRSSTSSETDFVTTMSSYSSRNQTKDFDTASMIAAMDSLSIIQPDDVKLPCFVLTPHKDNPDFVGREDVLLRAWQHLDPLVTPRREGVSREFAICGLGGMGKTQIAVKFAIRFQSEYSIVLWADGESRTKLAESFSRFARELGIKVNGADEVVALKEWLSATSHRWLMIFDNMDSDDKQQLLRDFLPDAQHGSVLITSRDSSLLGQFNGMVLQVLTKDEAVTMLLSLSNIDETTYSQQLWEKEHSAAVKIVTKIGFYPLGIRSAASIIVNDACRPTEFLEAFDNEELITESEAVLMVRPRHHEYHHSLRTVWNMCFDRLDTAQRTLLNIMSFCDPDRFQLSLLTNTSVEGADPDLAPISTRKKIRRSLTGLLRSSLVHKNDQSSQPKEQDEVILAFGLTDDGEEIGMHRLVQASCRVRMSLEQRRTHFKIAVNLVIRSWPVTPRHATWKLGIWPQQAKMLPHIQALCWHYVQSEQDDCALISPDDANWEFPQMLFNAGWYMYERGFLSSVAELLEPAKKYCLSHHDTCKRELLADIYGGLGSLNTEINNFQGAYDCFQEEWNCIQLAIKSGEITRPNVREANSYGRLGNGLHGLHRYSEAEKSYRACLEMWEQLPGDNLSFVTHLGTVLWLQGRLEEAENVVRPAIKDRNDKSTFRPGMALFALGNIEAAQAEVYEREGNVADAKSKYHDAEETHKQAMQLYQITLGKNHHKTADARHKCASHLHRRRDYGNAKTLLEQALAVYQLNRELFRNEIARTSYKLGCVMQDMGEITKGRDLILEGEALRKEIMASERWLPAKDERAFDEIVMFWSR